MGQADPFASRCSVKGCREQKIFIWLAPQYMDIRLVGLIVPEGRIGRKGKSSLVPSFFHSFLFILYLFIGIRSI
jgi:hypothetical protein